MEDRALAETFASAVRMRILNLLSTTPKSVYDIAREVGLRPTAVRFHLEKLLRLGLIEEHEKRGVVGRPRLLYRATGKRVEMAFPQRHYIVLSEALINALLIFDSKEVEERLRRVGVEIGSGLGKSLIEKTGLKFWGPDAFKEHFIEGMLRDYGAQPEIVEDSPKSIRYRENNCPFEELAVKHPALICDVLDTTINVALCRELNPSITCKNVKCIGHGDAYCEYIVSWNAEDAYT